MLRIEAAAHGVPMLLSSVVPVVDLLGAGCVVFKADDAASLRDNFSRKVLSWRLSVTLKTSSICMRACFSPGRPCFSVAIP